MCSPHHLTHRSLQYESSAGWCCVRASASAARTCSAGRSLGDDREGRTPECHCNSVAALRAARPLQRCVQTKGSRHPPCVPLTSPSSGVECATFPRNGSLVSVASTAQATERKRKEPAASDAMADTEACPMCGTRMPIERLVQHASNCDGVAPVGAQRGRLR